MKSRVRLDTFWEMKWISEKEPDDEKAMISIGISLYLESVGSVAELWLWHL